MNPNPRSRMIKALLFAACFGLAAQFTNTAPALARDAAAVIHLAQATPEDSEAAERKQKRLERKKAKQEKRKQAEDHKRKRQEQQRAKAEERKRKQQDQQRANQEKRKQAEERKRKRQERQRAKAEERERQKQEEQNANQEERKQAEERKRKRKRQERQRAKAEERERQQQEEQNANQQERKQAEERKRKRQERQRARAEERKRERDAQRAEEDNRAESERQQADRRKRERRRERLEAKEQRKLKRQENRMRKAEERRRRRLEAETARNRAETERLERRRNKLRRQLQRDRRQAERRDRRERRLERQQAWERKQARRERRNRRRDFAFHRRSKVVKRRDDRVILSGVIGAAAGALATAMFVHHNDDRRFGWRAKDFYVEPVGNGWTRTVVRRADGSRVVTIRDSAGFVVRRYRVYRDGRRVFYYNNQPGWWDDGDLNVNVDPVRVRIPRNRYIVEPSNAPVETIYSAVTAGPVDDLGRTYTLNQVLINPQLRGYMPRIDLDTITFASGSADIPIRQVEKLETIGVAIEQAIKDRPGEVFLIEGHTDAVGTDVANLDLSDRRAAAVADVLTNYYGIPPENLVTQGYGEQFLKVDTLAGEQANRRVAVRRITPLLSKDNDQLVFDEDGNETFGN
ncbi:MAG: OmpA family protein [Alphaproteobacteria bacterium]|nr:OmpA family protein [Alphaproteobacteria bacterium]